MISAESFIHQQVCDYLRYQYPDVPFRTDFAAGTKLTMGQAVRNKRLQSGRAWPDLFIARAVDKKSDKLEGLTYHYCGLFIELKAKVIYKKDGSLLVNEHLQEQQKVLGKLASEGYKAEFAVGFDAARKIIDDYLS